MKLRKFDSTKETPLDALDLQLLSRLANVGCHLRLGELVNENRDHDLSEADVLERMERLAVLGYVRPYHAFSATPEGTAVLPPRVHHQRPLAA